MTQSAFERLKPICVHLSKEPTNEGINQLKSLLDAMGEGALQPLQHYVLFPLRLVLRDPRKVPTGCCENAIGCIRQIFLVTTVNEWQVFSDFFSTLCILISEKSNFSKASKHPEELKLAVIQCLETLLKRASNDVLRQLYSPEFLPAVGHAVSLLIALAESERLRELRVTSMTCLQTLAQCREGELMSHVEEARDCFGSFLPGITMSLCRIIQGDQKQGQNVTNIAIKTWSSIVAMVMSDFHSPIQPECHLDKGGAKHAGRDLLIKRTQDWVESTAKKLDILIGQIVTLSTNPNWKIRTALVTFSEELLFSCKRSLSPSIPKLLEVLVSLVGDEYNEVASHSKRILSRFSEAHMRGTDGEEGEDARPLVELLEDNLHSLMTSLPRIMRTSDDTCKLSTLNLVIGYLKLLGPRISSLLNSISHLRRLSLALIQILEFDLRDIKILEETTSGPDGAAFSMEVYQHCPTRRKYFKHFTDDKIYKAVVQVCHLLGLYGNITLLVDHFLDLFHETSSHQKQAVLILNEIMLGSIASPMDDSNKASWEGSACPALRENSEIESAVRNLLQEYTSPSHWYLTTTPSQSESAMTHKGTASWLVVSQREDNSISLAALNSNVLLISLFLEGIGAFSQVLSPAFTMFLMDCLYSVLEKVDDSKSIISQTAYSTLMQMYMSCGYESIPDLLSSNSDYLVESISSGLRHLDMYPKTPLVLKVTLQHSNADMLPLLQDTIDEILVTLDEYHQDVAPMMIDVLKTLVVAIIRWFPEEKKKRSPLEGQQTAEQSVDESQSNNQAVTHQTIKEFFLEHLRLKRLAHGDVREEDIEGSVDDSSGDEVYDCEDEVDKEKELPLHVKTVKEVLSRCLHFLSSSDPRLRLKVLDIIQNGIIALQNYKDELLPLIHRLWPAFVQRFKDTEQLVSCKACEALVTMGDTSGDFIQKRIIKDVWSKLVSFLTTQSNISEKCGPAYRHTPSCKLQLAIFALLGPLCITTGIGGSELATMASACLPYLNARQPEVLQHAAFNVFKTFGSLEPDAMWLALNDIYCPTTLKAPHECFQSHKFVGETHPQRNQYLKNVQKLLDQLNTW
ncbi:TELO2-interacting protein 1 homolog [Asterias amurensis]|uniref:TELO2-interacting protein 1 homolog n=1 Tax=Asterias amurensis TaxID=7602 RepID=UPI003AB19D9B